MSERSEDIFNKIAATAVLGVVLTGASGVVSKIWNSVVDDNRVDDLNRIAQVACTVPPSNHVNDLGSTCRDLASDAIKHGDAATDPEFFVSRDDSYDSRWFLLFPDTRGTKFYEHAKEKIANDVPKMMREEFDTMATWDESYQRLQKAVQNVVVDGKKPFNGAGVDVALQSIVPVTDKDGNATGKYTGKFRVVVTDPGSDAGRIFEYDHATGNVSQTMGTTSGTASFHIDLSGYESGYNYGLLSGGGYQGAIGLHGGASGSVNLQNTGPVDCREADHHAACAVVLALHQELNRMDQKHLANLQDEIRQTARVNVGRDIPESADHFARTAFPAIDLNN